MGSLRRLPVEMIADEKAEAIAVEGQGHVWSGMPCRAGRRWRGKPGLGRCRWRRQRRRAALTIQGPWVVGAQINQQWSVAGWGHKHVNAMLIQSRRKRSFHYGFQPPARHGARTERGAVGNWP